MLLPALLTAAAAIAASLLPPPASVTGAASVPVGVWLAAAPAWRLLL